MKISFGSDFDPCQNVVALFSLSAELHSQAATPVFLKK